MQYISHYESPFGPMLAAADEEALTGLWFEGQKYFGAGLAEERIERETPVLAAARRWLDVYFSGKEPDFTVPLRPAGTPFRREVWDCLQAVSYGAVVSYGDLADWMARKTGYFGYISPRAVGGAVGHNPIALFIPCHRVIGADGSLTGYAAGTAVKEKLLRLEGAIGDEPGMMRMCIID